MTATNWCDRDHKEVQIGDCVRCHRLCIHSPHHRRVWLWDAEFVQRWGAYEIERFLAEVKHENAPNLH
jgi:hypothetical protein